MVLNCGHVWDQISEYLDGTLSPEMLAMVQNHLDHCEICSAILDSTRNILVLVADGRTFELPVNFSARLPARLTDFLAHAQPDPLPTQIPMP